MLKILIAVLIIIILFCIYHSNMMSQLYARIQTLLTQSENFGPCTDCPVAPEQFTYAVNPFRWPASGSQYRSQWQFAPNGVKPPNTTDAAEALAPNNISGMNLLAVPDQEYLTN
jgi:hypothetical protein